MIELACCFGMGPVGVPAIAEKQGISAKYIHLLMAGLKSAGLVRSVRGPGGGYELARDPSDITALDIVSVLEGVFVPVECVVDDAFCLRVGYCTARSVWSSVASAMDGALSKLTLADLARKELAARKEALTYHI